MEDFNATPFEKVNLNRNSLKGLNNRRSDIEILAVILRVTWNSAKKTKLLHQANLSGCQLKKYLEFLIKSGFISERPTSKRVCSYKTTTKGTLFLFHWTKILYLLEV
jgi:predicted transcriptional regulator